MGTGALLLIFVDALTWTPRCAPAASAFGQKDGDGGVAGFVAGVAERSSVAVTLPGMTLPGAGEDLELADGGDELLVVEGENARPRRSTARRRRERHCAAPWGCAGVVGVADEGEQEARLSDDAFDHGERFVDGLEHGALFDMDFERGECTAAGGSQVSAMAFGMQGRTRGWLVRR